MTDTYAIVVTTINPPTPAVVAIRNGAGALGAQFHVVGDAKSPPDFDLPGARYLDLAAQRDTGFAFAGLCPTGHYARKNIGYLAAARSGATVIIETDDDNAPGDGFWTPRQRMQTAPVVRTPGWCNVYAYYTDAQIWPRGLPLNRLQTAPDPLDSMAVETSDCPIQQGLANGDPDVDAIYRLVLPLPISFDREPTVVLGEGVWCPFNSQNTTFWREAFPLLYLPFHCSFRMTDIWRSFIAQRISWENGWRLQFHRATVFQDRNEHDLMRDFADEVPGYLHNERIRKTLEDLPLASGEAAILDNLVKAYEALIDLGVVGQDERPLVAAWAEDMARL